MTPAQIKQSRTALNFSVKELAEALDMDERTIRRLEKGDYTASRVIELAIMYLINERGEG